MPARLAILPVVYFSPRTPLAQASRSGEAKPNQGMGATLGSAGYIYVAVAAEHKLNKETNPQLGSAKPASVSRTGNRAFHCVSLLPLHQP